MEIRLASTARVIVAALVLLICQTGFSPASALVTDAQTIREGLHYSRAIEASVWARSLLNYKAARDSFFSHGVGYNDVTYYSKIQTWRFQVGTPNNTTPYWWSFWNVKNGPVVLEIPAASDEVKLFGTLMDAWQRPLEDIGATGADKGKGGKYLLVHKDYKGAIPEGYIVVRQTTYDGFTIIRPIVKDNQQASIDKASAVAKTIRSYYLGKKSSTKHVDVYMKNIEGTLVFDDTLYDSLHEILQDEYLEEKDKVMLGMLKSLGIERGKPFKPSTEQRGMLKNAAKDSHDYMLDMYHNVLLPPYYEGKHWTNLVNRSVPETGFTLVYPDYVDVDNRGALYYAIISSVKNFGASTYYLVGAKDNNGMYLDGGSNYTLHVAAKVPAKHFWSAVVYDLETAGWLRNQDKVGVASTDTEIQINADGSADLYFGPKTPKGKESNWVPTTPGRKFFLLFRFFGPEKAVFDKSWQLHDLEILD